MVFGNGFQWFPGNRHFWCLQYCLGNSGQLKTMVSQWFLKVPEAGHPPTACVAFFLLERKPMFSNGFFGYFQETVISDAVQRHEKSMIYLVWELYFFLLNHCIAA